MNMLRNAAFFLFGIALISLVVFGEGYILGAHIHAPEITQGINWNMHFFFMGVVFLTGCLSLLNLSVSKK